MSITTVPAGEGWLNTVNNNFSFINASNTAITYHDASEATALNGLTMHDGWFGTCKINGHSVIFGEFNLENKSRTKLGAAKNMHILKIPNATGYKFVSGSHYMQWADGKDTKMNFDAAESDVWIANLSSTDLSYTNIDLTFIITK